MSETNLGCRQVDVAKP